MGTEYCFTLFAEGTAFLDIFDQPPVIDTVWGSAERAEQAGKLLWGSDTYISIGLLDSFRNGLCLRLPAERRAIDYTVLHVDGPYFESIDSVPLSARLTDLPSPSSFSKMINSVFRSSATWALFVLHHCDDMEKAFALDVESTITLMDRFLYEEPPELRLGFSVISPYGATMPHCYDGANYG